MIFFKQKLPVLVGSIVLVILVMQGAQAMGLFSKKEPAYPFSGFSGQIFYQGKPAVGAKVTRSYQLLGEEDVHKETIQADDEGRFSFESIVVDYRTPFLAPVEFLAYQDIHILYEGNEYHVWTAAKRKKEEYAEFENTRKEVSCELTEEPQNIERKNGEGLLVTSCYW